MSNVIDFLERVGQDASLRHASSDELAIVLNGTPIDSCARAAILAADQQQIEALLGQGNLYCMLAPAKDEEDDEEESPSRDGDEAELRQLMRAVA